MYQSMMPNVVRTCESHREIQEHVSLVRGRRSACKIANMGCRCPGPIEDDIERQHDATRWVEPPNPGIVSNQGKDDL